MLFSSTPLASSLGFRHGVRERSRIDNGVGFRNLVSGCLSCPHPPSLFIISFIHTHPTLLDVTPRPETRPCAPARFLSLPLPSSSLLFPPLPSSSLLFPPLRLQRRVASPKPNWTIWALDFGTFLTEFYPRHTFRPQQLNLQRAEGAIRIPGHCLLRFIDRSPTSLMFFGRSNLDRSCLGRNAVCTTFSRSPPFRSFPCRFFACRTSPPRPHLPPFASHA
ncbi:hypothetical protein RJ55_02562 [Drechmeria coniospora]|nr:hypothetical protein RJ55_02562 [Drechmeria coniospora]